MEVTIGSAGPAFLGARLQRLTGKIAFEFPIRAAIMVYDGKLPRAKTEYLVWVYLRPPGEER